jgi:hypothetical protein
VWFIFFFQQENKQLAYLSPTLHISFDRMVGHFPSIVHLALPLLLFSTIDAACPQACNKRGNCNRNNQCECWNGFRGAACGEFICPTHVPWFEAASATDTAHQPLTETECSTMGTCNRLNGKCVCYDGFEGIACEIMSCPNNCNDHGRCTLLSDAATGDDDLHLHVTTTYTMWDAKRIYGCLCDEGFTGYDCSMRTCTQGQDPRLSYASTMVDETQTYTCTASSGSFKFGFRGDYENLSHVKILTVGGSTTDERWIDENLTWSYLLQKKLENKKRKIKKENLWI